VSAPRRVPCPACGKPAIFEPSNPVRPFCSERCRTADLGAWAAGSYRIPGPEDEAPAAEDDAGPRSG